MTNSDRSVSNLGVSIRDEIGRCRLELIADYVADASTSVGSVKFITADAYLASIGRVDELFDVPILAALPLRPLGSHLDPWWGALTSDGRRHSLLITQDKSVIVRNQMRRIIQNDKTRTDRPKVVAFLSSDADLHQQLASRNLGISRVLPWVRSTTSVPQWTQDPPY